MSRRAIGMVVLGVVVGVFIFVFVVLRYEECVQKCCIPWFWRKRRAWETDKEEWYRCQTGNFGRKGVRTEVFVTPVPDLGTKLGDCATEARRKVCR